MKRNLQFSFLFLLTFATSLVGQTSITIEQARATNTVGQLERLGELVILEGKAIGPNFRPGGQTFVLFDVQSDIGITVFSIDMDFGYSVQDYDNLRVTGTLAQFNGLAEIIPTSIEVLGPGGFNPAIAIVTLLDENTESKLVVFKNASLVDPSQWSDSGSFNVDLTNGTSTIQVRIDSDTDISGMPAPTGTFDLTGIGGQFDADEPFDGGYQLFPRSIADINPYNTGGGGPSYKSVTMAELRANDASGVPNLNEDMVELTSIVYGVNLRPAGLQFTLIDESNQGVAVFSLDENWGYTVTEGDEVFVQGTVGHFNGLTQITLDSISLISQDNDLVQARTVDQLDESTESSLIMFFVNDLPDPTEWKGDGSSFNVTYLDGAGTPFLVRIDNDTYWSTEMEPGAQGISWTGIGGQFDGDAPHDSGYQLLPRYEGDLGYWLSTYELGQSAISIIPNPTTGFITVESKDIINRIALFNLHGQKLLETTDQQITLEPYQTGNYLLQVKTDKGNSFRKVVKI